jgi:hypothetical protein
MEKLHANQIYYRNIIEILLKVAINAINLNHIEINILHCITKLVSWRHFNTGNPEKIFLTYKISTDFVLINWYPVA